MKNLVIIGCILLTSSSFCQKYSTEKSKVTFFSDAAIEDITATITKAISIFNIESGEIAFSIPVKEFEFAKSLMKEHFNEKYMETEKFPKATFQGTIQGYQLNVTGQQAAKANGKLSIHGITKEVEVQGTVDIGKETVHLQSKFKVKLDDYGVPRPQLLWQNIAEEVEVTIDFTFIPHEKK